MVKSFDSGGPVKNLKISFLIACLFSLNACENLQTRGEIREAEQKQKVHEQVVVLQRTTADTNNRFSDIEAELRSLNGKVEVLENRLAQSGQDREKIKGLIESQGGDNTKKIMILQEEIARMNERMEMMTAEMNAMKAAAAEAQATPPAAQKSLFEVAEEMFEKKDWRKAILNYQKFRDTNPKHRNFPEATYKIGVSFQELGMKDEAKTFYDEVVAKYPNSAEAKKAKSRLKSLKK